MPVLEGFTLTFFIIRFELFSKETRTKKNALELISAGIS